MSSIRGSDGYVAYIYGKRGEVKVIHEVLVFDLRNAIRVELLGEETER